MQPGAGDFAQRVEARHVGAAAQVGHDAAAGVVRRRHHRDRLLRHVDAELEAPRVDVGEVRVDEVRALVGDVEIDAIDAALLDLEVDGARHDVARGELGARVVARHEALAVGQLEQPALAAHRLARSGRTWRGGGRGRSGGTG